MNQSKKIEVEGTVLKALPNTTFKVDVDDQDKDAVCHLSGKMRLNRIRVLPGDRVKIEMVPIDKTKGRITYRFKR